MAEFWLAVVFSHVPKNLKMEEKYWQGIFAFISSSLSVFPQRNVHQVLGPGPRVNWAQKLMNLVN